MSLLARSPVVSQPVLKSSDMQTAFRGTVTPRSRSSLVTQALFKRQERQQTVRGKAPPPKKVEYGSDWYEQTRKAGGQQNVREELERRRKANLEANNGKERKDLYTDNWDGDSYKGSQVNVLTVLGAISLLAPIIGLYFAFQTYGTLWG